MSNIQTGAERMPHDLSHLGFLAGQIGRLITISTTPVIAGDSFEMDAVGALRLSPLRRGLAIDSTVDIFTFYFFSSRRRHTRCDCDWSSDVCSSDLGSVGVTVTLTDGDGDQVTSAAGDISTHINFLDDGPTAPTVTASGSAGVDETPGVQIVGGASDEIGRAACRGRG